MIDCYRGPGAYAPGYMLRPLRGPTNLVAANYAEGVR